MRKCPLKLQPLCLLSGTPLLSPSRLEELDEEPEIMGHVLICPDDKQNELLSLFQ